MSIYLHEKNCRLKRFLTIIFCLKQINYNSTVKSRKLLVNVTNYCNY